MRTFGVDDNAAFIDEALGECNAIESIISTVHSALPTTSPPPRNINKASWIESLFIIFLLAPIHSLACSGEEGKFVSLFRLNNFLVSCRERLFLTFSITNGMAQTSSESLEQKKSFHREVSEREERRAKNDCLRSKAQQCCFACYFSTFFFGNNVREYSASIIIF